MGKKFLSILACMLMTASMALAQKQITGTVVDAESGEALIGVAVRIPDTTTGVLTDVNGNFSITLPAGAKNLNFSFMGMKPATLTARDGMRVLMETDTKAMDEVIVVAYGLAKKASFTGAAGVMDSEKLETRKISDVTNALAGNVAGVTALKSTGQPGTSSTIRIRGFGSINANMNPLYVLDGMPYEGDISAIDPKDVDQISVLKDAAATSLYGARAANGVIMITTKKGRQSTEAKVNFEASWGSNSRQVKTFKTIDDTNTYYEQLYRSNYNDAIYNLGYNAGDAHIYANSTAQTATGYNIYTVPQNETLFNVGGKVNPNARIGYSDGKYFYRPDDWQKESFNHGLRQEYKASVSGGSKKLTYYFGAGYLQDDGVIKQSGFNRISTRSNVEYQVKDWLKLTANLMYTNSKSKYPGEQETFNSSGNAFGIASYFGPVYPFYARNADGSIMYNGENPVYDYGDRTTGAYTRNVMSIANPIGDLTYQTEEYLMDIFNSRWGVDLTPVRGLTLSYRLGLNLDNTRYHYASSSMYGQSKSYGGEADQQHQHTQALTQQVMATYHNTFANAHSIDLLAAYETYDWRYEMSDAYGQNLYKEGDWSVYNTIDQRIGSGYYHKYAMRSWIGRANYDYKEKYFGSVSIRRDGSSRFHKDNRWGTFWSASAAWNIAREDFLKNQKWINFLKLRLSYGQQGNDRLATSSSGTYYNTFYAYLDQYRMTGADGVFSDGTLWYKGNKELTWEKSNAFDLAIDFEFWNGRLSGSIDYYNRTTKDMLYNKPVAVSNGYSSIPMNIGSMRNRGIEVDLHSKVFDTKNFKWNVDFNISHNSNKILELAPELEGELIDGTRIYREGHSMYQYYLVKYAGVDPTNGMALYWAKDANGNEYATSDWSVARSSNRQATGNLQATVFGGLGTTLEAYGFDLSVQCSYQMGGKLYDNGYQSLMHNGGSDTAGDAWSTDILRAWTPENTITDVPRLANSDLYTNSQSDRWLVSSNYFAINNITLGYTVPKSLLSKLKMEAVRVYFSADNVALFSARKGLDPRIGAISSQNKYYSALRTITGGIKVTF
jgi:TonB-linked SusC/RagA family outer membrane protein